MEEAAFGEGGKRILLWKDPVPASEVGLTLEQYVAVIHNVVKADFYEVINYKK
jgi:hypothetical protein